MYCKKCGKLIDDDSKYCRYCGEGFDSVNNQLIKVSEKDDEVIISKKAKTFWIVFLIVSFVCLVAFVLYSSYDSNKATNNDIELVNDASISLSYAYIVTPKENIKGLEITFKFYGDDRKLITKKVKVLGNVVKNEQYSISFSLNDFSIDSLTKISNYSYKVTGGTKES